MMGQIRSNVSQTEKEKGLNLKAQYINKQMILI